MQRKQVNAEVMFFSKSFFFSREIIFIFLHVERCIVYLLQSMGVLTANREWGSLILSFFFLNNGITFSFHNIKYTLGRKYKLKEEAKIIC